MEGYQYAHIEVWSVQGRTGSGPDDHATRKNGQRAWTAEQIFDELERVAGASEHVIPGRPAPEILSGDASSFVEMRDMHETASTIRESYIRRPKGKEPVAAKRKLRKDASSLYVSVMSLPVRSEDALSDPGLRRQATDVLEQALEHETARISNAGGTVLGGVLHWDEEYLHIHVVAIDPVRGRVDHLHPGRSAKAAVNADPDAPADPKARGKVASQAYRDAMIGWQDDLHEDVFGPAGLMRLGPGRLRWSRQEYSRAKKLTKDRALHEDRVADLKRRGKAQERRQAEQNARETVLARKEATAGKKVREAEQAAAKSEAYRAALETGSNAIARRELDYSPASKDIPEGLKFGPSAPRDEEKRERLLDIVKPAYGFLVDLAKTFFNLRKIKKREAKRAAQNQQAAAQIVEEREATGQSYSDVIARIAAGESLPLERSSFPGAWFVARDADVRKLERELDDMSNVSVRRTWTANWQSRQLCDDRPDLADELGLGQRLLEFTAKQRGYDLETGKHHPDKATDPSRARIHLDTEPDPIRIVITHAQRVRVRTE